MSEPEDLVMRFHGGPLDGDRIMERTWPLPDEIPAPNGIGRYVKTDESKVERTLATAKFLRGAEYAWDADWTLESEATTS